MRNLIILLICLLPMIGFSQIQLVGNITTFAGGSYPTHIDSLAKGGLRVVADAAERNAITQLRRKVGMVVFQVSDSTLYRLRAPITSNDWVAITTGGGSFDDFIIAADSGSPATISDGETTTHSGGTGLTTVISGNTVTTNIDNTGITAATYGSASQVPVTTYNAQGQATGSTNTTIAITAGQVTGLKDTIRVLATGQSNMAGSATNTGLDTLANSNFFVWDSVRAVFEVAHINNYPFGTSYSPAFGFGKRLAEEGKVVMMVFRPQGSTSIIVHNPYTGWVNTALRAQQTTSGMGGADVMLWHQGESNGNGASGVCNLDACYVDSLLSIKNRMQTLGALKQSGLFIAGELLTTGTAAFSARNIALHIATARDQEIKLATANMLTSGDGLHFDHASQVQFGKNYYGAYKGYNTNGWAKIAGNTYSEGNNIHVGYNYGDVASPRAVNIFGQINLANTNKWNAIGLTAGSAINTGSGFVLFGENSGKLALGLGGSVIIGNDAADALNAVNTDITIVGANALASRTAALTFATGVGASVWSAANTGTLGTAFGAYNQQALTSGINDTKGNLSMFRATTATLNVADGASSLYECLTCTRNIAVGQSNQYNGKATNRVVSVGHAGLFWNYGNEISSSGDEVGYYNGSGSSLALFGTRAGYYNSNGNRNSYFGADAGNTATDSLTISVSSIDASTEIFTTPAHGLTVGKTYSLRLVAATPPGGMSTNTYYPFTVLSTTTLFSVYAVSSAGSGTIDLIKINEYANATAIGYNAEPDKSNQVTLGDLNITELRARNYRFNVDQTVGAGQDNYVMAYTHSSAEIGLVAGSSIFGGPYLPLAGGTLTGNLLFSTDNTLDLGASGLTRPRTGYFGTSVISPIFNATTGYQIGGAATSGKILKADGTNFVASTETYAAPGSSGNVMTSDGTNWTSAAPAAAVVNLSLTGTSQIIELTNSAGTDVVFKGVDIGLTKVAGTKDTLYFTKIEHWGEVSIAGGSTSVTAGTPERPDNDTPGTPTASLSSEFTQSGSTVTYIGAAGQLELTGAISFTTDAIGDYLVSLYQEGVELPVTEVRVSCLIGSYVTIPVLSISVNVATNDTFDLRIEPVTGSANITVHRYNVYARKIY